MCDPCPPPLAEDPSSLKESFELINDCFKRANIAVTPTGVVREHATKAFTVVPDTIELGQIIGKGASSFVQVGVHTPSQTPLALKVLSVFDKSKRDQLMAEINTLYDADCDCIVTFYGAYYREGSVTIALELMDGGSLTNVLQQVGIIPEPILAGIMYQIIWATAYLMAEDKMHRDLKPSNVLINSAGNVKLTDFGITRAISAADPCCKTFVGTLKYMAPERILSHPYSYDADVWSLGLIALECATGKYPFPEGPEVSYVDLCVAVTEGPEPTVTALAESNSTLSLAFFAFLGVCLKKNPKDRILPNILLGSPWLHSNGITGLAAAIERVKSWIDSLSGEPMVDEAC